MINLLEITREMYENNDRTIFELSVRNIIIDNKVR